MSNTEFLLLQENDNGCRLLENKRNLLGTVTPHIAMNTEKASRGGSRDDWQQITRIGDSRGQSLRLARDTDWGDVHRARHVRGKAAAGLVFLAVGAVNCLDTSRFRHPYEKTILLVLFHPHEVAQVRARGSHCFFPDASCSLRQL
jgi:hypothetical protein